MSPGPDGSPAQDGSPGDAAGFNPAALVEHLNALMSGAGLRRALEEREWGRGVYRPDGQLDASRLRLGEPILVHSTLDLSGLDEYARTTRRLYSRMPEVLARERALRGFGDQYLVPLQLADGSVVGDMKISAYAINGRPDGWVVGRFVEAPAPALLTPEEARRRVSEVSGLPEAALASAGPVRAITLTTGPTKYTRSDPHWLVPSPDLPDGGYLVAMGLPSYHHPVDAAAPAGRVARVSGLSKGMSLNAFDAWASRYGAAFQATEGVEPQPQAEGGTREALPVFDTAVSIEEVR